MIRRMRPPASIDLDLDRAQRAVYLQQLWSFVSALPLVSNSLKAHVLWHLLDAGRQRDASVDPSLFTTYLQLPRNAGYLPRRCSNTFVATISPRSAATSAMSRAWIRRR